MLLLEIVDVCNDLAVLRVIKFIKNLLDLIQVLVPVILAVLCMIDFVKALFAGEDKKITTKIVKRILAAIIIFFVVPIINYVFALLGEGNVDASDCWNNANDENIEILAEQEKIQLDLQREEAKTEREKRLQEQKAKFEQIRLSTLSRSQNNDNNIDISGKTDATDVSNPMLSLGGQIVTYASQFIGNKYKYGGTNPYVNDWSMNDGIDCSAFTQFVFKQYGINLPRTSREQATVGTAVNGIENAQAGDLIFYAKNGVVNHVAIYMGGNKVVHASSAKTGIKIGNNASYRTIAAIRRYIN